MGVSMAMTVLQPMPAKSPLRLAMEARDVDAIVDAFAPDAEFRSPLTGKLVFKGRARIEAVAKVTLEVLEDFHYYTEEMVNDRTGFLVAQAQIDGLDVEIVDRIQFHPDGKIQTLTVFFRPPARRRGGAAPDRCRIRPPQGPGPRRVNIGPRRPPRAHDPDR
jgi:SnoaL-like domain